MELNITDETLYVHVIENPTLIGDKYVALRPLFEAEGAVYNPTTKKYELYKSSGGLSDISEEEMIIIYNSKNRNVAGNTYSYAFANSQARIQYTLKGMITQENYTFNGYAMFYGCTNLEYVKLIDNTITQIRFGNISMMFYNCQKLKRIVEVISVQDATSASHLLYAFDLCHDLESVRIKDLKYNINFRHASKLNKESLRYMIQNSAATSALVITLHATVYAWASTDTDVQGDLTAKPLVSIASA